MAKRGVELVEEVIKKAKKDRDFEAQPIAESALAQLTLPGGRPLTPSLRLWLAFDGDYLSLFDSLKKPAFKPLSFLDLMTQEFGADDYGMWNPFANLLPGECLLVPGGSDSRRFLYLGTPDSIGEYPVFVVDTDDLPFMCIESPGIDVYLAEHFEVGRFSRGTYEALYHSARWKESMEEQARLNFRGFRSFGLDHAVLLDGSEITPNPDGSLPDPAETRIGRNPFTGEEIEIPVLTGPPVPAPRKKKKVVAKKNAKKKKKKK
jgi:hypothetical protein